MTGLGCTDIFALEDRETAVRLGDKNTVDISTGLQIGNRLSPIDELARAHDVAAHNRLEVVDFDLDRCADLAGTEGWEKRSTHSGVGEGEQDCAMHDRY